MKKILILFVLFSLSLIPSTMFAFPSVYPTGTTIYKPEKSWNGYTIFPAADFGMALIDMNGNVVNQWKETPFTYANPSRLLPGGHAMRPVGSRKYRIYNHPEANHLVQFDWNGNVVWKFDKAGPHHDWQREGNPVGLISS